MDKEFDKVERPQIDDETEALLNDKASKIRDESDGLDNEVIPENIEEPETYDSDNSDDFDFLPPRKSKKKLLFICGGVAIFLLVVSIIIFMLPNPGAGNKDLAESQSSEVSEIVVPEEIEVKYSSNEETARQGMIKRVLGDRVVIAPDDNTGDVIYYVKDQALLSTLTAGLHLEYNYVIEDFLPYLTSTTIIQTGKITYKGLMTLTIQEGSEIKKLQYSDNLSNIIKKLKVNDIVEYVSKNEQITSIFKVNNTTDVLVEDEGTNENINAQNPLINKGSTFNRDDFFEEYLIIDNRFPEEMIIDDSQIQNNKIDFYNAITDPVWIRVAWRVTDLMPTVPNVENVNLTLTTPSGQTISRNNIEDFGRMWVDGNIVNFAIRTPEAGEWSLHTDKKPGTRLGEVEMHVMKLSGFISIDKFGANLINRDELELIWNIGGVPDDGLEMEVYLTSERFSTMIFKASSKDESLHIIDKRVINISNIPKGQYNVIVKVKDLDIIKGEDGKEIPKNTMLVTAETIQDEKDVGILIIS